MTDRKVTGAHYGLSDWLLQRLTALEQEKILTEYREVLDNIADLLDILARPERIWSDVTPDFSRRSIISNKASDGAVPRSTLM